MRWQVKSTLLIAVVAPPIAGLALQVIQYWPQWLSGHAEPNQVASSVLTLPLTIALSYIFGVLPAALAGAGYCGLLTCLPARWRRRSYRLIVAAVLGGAAGATFGRIFSDAPVPYAWLCGGVAAFLAVFIPKSGHEAA